MPIFDMTFSRPLPIALMYCAMAFGALTASGKVLPMEASVSKAR